MTGASVTSSQPVTSSPGGTAHRRAENGETTPPNAVQASDEAEDDSRERRDDDGRGQYASVDMSVGELLIGPSEMGLRHRIVTWPTEV